MTTAFADRAREAESSVLLALRTKDWLSPEDLMARTAVAGDTARAHCERFWQMGLVARRGAYPNYRYRALRVPLHDAGRAYLRSIPEQNRSASVRMDCAKRWTDSEMTSAIPLPATRRRNAPPINGVAIPPLPARVAAAPPEAASSRVGHPGSCRDVRVLGRESRRSRRATTTDSSDSTVTKSQRR